MSTILSCIDVARESTYVSHSTGVAQGDDDESKGTVGCCIAQDGFGRKCTRPKLAWSLYCERCYEETRGLGM